MVYLFTTYGRKGKDLRCRLSASPSLVHSNEMAPFFSGAARFWASVSSVIQQRPLTCNSLAGGTLCGASDVLAQYLESRQRRVKASPPNQAAAALLVERDWFCLRRTASASLIGCFIGGGVYPFAYAKLDAIWQGTNFSTVLQKSIVEIFTVGIFVNTISMTSRGILVGREPKNVLSHVRQEMPEVTLNDIKLWLPYNMIAFTFIPAYIFVCMAKILLCEYFML